MVFSLMDELALLKCFDVQLGGRCAWRGHQRTYSTLYRSTGVNRAASAPKSTVVFVRTRLNKTHQYVHRSGTSHLLESIAGRDLDVVDSQVEGRTSRVPGSSVLGGRTGAPLELRETRSRPRRRRWHALIANGYAADRDGVNDQTPTSAYYASDRA